MAHNRVTSADILLMNDSEEFFGVYNEAEKAIPEIQYIGAAPCEKTSYKTMIQTGLPAVGFRDSNVGIDQGKPTFANRQVQCMFLDASWSLDTKVAQECEWGEDVAITLAAQAAMQAALQKIAAQTWYGTAADANGFTGIASLLPYTDSAMVINAGGSTANTATSIYAVRSELQGVLYAWGKNGRIKNGGIVKSEQWDSGKKFWAYTQEVSSHIGLQIPSVQCIGRICNITAQAGKGATDNLIAQLLEMFPAGKEPNMIFMTKRSLGQLRASRVATNATGTAAPYPADVFGIPVYVTDSIKNTEAIVTTTPSAS
jgi:hypothetical protein